MQNFQMDRAIIYSAQNAASTTALIKVESQYADGFSQTMLLGGGGEAVKGGKERARQALSHLGCNLSEKRIIINLSPAEVKKEGSHFDLPMALSMLIHHEIDRSEKANSKGHLAIRKDLNRYIFTGELGLDGTLLPVKGTVSYALLAIEKGFSGLVVPEENCWELQRIIEKLKGKLAPLQIIGFTHLSEVLGWVEGGEIHSSRSLKRGESETETGADVNFDDMVLNDEQKLLAETVCAGAHSLLLRGTPGVGKSMFAKRLPSLLPSLDRQSLLESLKIHSQYASRISDSLLRGRPPCRSPHHQASSAAVIGSDRQPGELSLAHGGMLFLDEFPEFRRDLIEALREPLESGEIFIARAQSKCRWSAQVHLIATANNCPCGWNGSSYKSCRCSGPKILHYQNKLSGPILDRIDLHVTFSEPANKNAAFKTVLQGAEKSGQTLRMRERVLRARTFATRRATRLGLKNSGEEHEAFPPNATLDADKTTKCLELEPGVSLESMLQSVIEAEDLQLSNRSLLRMLRVARTLADLDESKSVTIDHLAQSAQWQSREHIT